MFLAVALATCLTVDSEKILARDVARAIPAFEALAPDTPLGFAPLPGAQRTIQAAELESWLRRDRINAEVRDPLCFEWPLRRLEKSEVERTMLAALGRGRVEVVELSQYPAPRGKLVFPLATLPSRAGTDGTAVWKGQVQYAGSRKFDVWARVKVAVPQTRVVAKEPLRAGEPIQAEQLSLEQYDGLPAAKDTATTVVEVVGSVPKKPLPAGTTMLLGWLEAPKAIAKGDVVQVEVRTGAARLVLQAKAGAAGAVGAIIPMENMDSKNTFSARVEAPGKVLVVR